MCQGDQLELTCTNTGMYLELSVSLIHEGEITARRYSRILTFFDAGYTRLIVVNSTVFNFSIISARYSLPLISRLYISSVSDNLSGIEVTCTDIETSETASTLINVINEDLIFGKLQKVIKFDPNHCYA